MAGMAANVSLFRRHIDDADRSVVKFDRTTTDVGRNIDKLSGRLGLLVDVAATLGPALIPTAAAAVPVMAGLTNQLGFAAIGAGTAVLAFHGIGDALKAVNEAAINPTEANLAKMNEAMGKLGPAGRDFVRELRSLQPELMGLQAIAQEGLFPGITEGIDQLSVRLPAVERVIATVSRTMGDLVARGAESLAGPEWDDFFNMLETEAEPTLVALGETIGNLTKGLADLWVAFTPLSRDFSSGFLNMSQDFAKWADGLSQTQGFAEFVNYLETTGPRVAQALGAISNAILQVLEATAPLGGPALAAITTFSNVIAKIADSDIGTPLLAGLAALRAYSLAASIAGRATQTAFGGAVVGNLSKTGGALRSLKSDVGTLATSYMTAGARSQRELGRMAEAGGRVKTAIAGVGPAAALMALQMTGASEAMGLTNTTSLALVGTLGGPWGAAAGAAVGGALDLSHANDELKDSIVRLNASVGTTDWSAFNGQLASVRKQVDDLQHITGVGDFFSDVAKVTANAFTGKGLSKSAQVRNYAAQADAAAANQMAVARERGAAQQARALADANAIAAKGFQLTAAGAREAGRGIQGFTQAAQAANAAISKQGNLDAYRSSLMDFADALKENGRTLSAQSRAGLENRANLRGIATSALQAAEGLKNFGVRTKFLQGARRDFIGAAVAAGSTRAAARALATQFGLVDRIHAKPTVTESGSAESRARVKGLRSEIASLKGKIVDAKEKGATESSGRVRGLRARIAELRGKIVQVQESGASGSAGRVAGLRGQIAALRSKTITITTNYASVRTGSAVAGRIAKADGGPVYASGGQSRGARDDSIPALLSHREYVQPVSAVDFYGERLMDDIRARRFPKPQGYADGGPVRMAGGGLTRKERASAARGFDIGTLSVSSTQRELDQFARAISKAGGRVGSNFGTLSRQILANAAQFEKNSKAVASLREKQASAREAAVGAFNNNIFGGSLADLRTQLEADRNDARSSAAALAQARRNGLTGDLAAGLAGSGNAALAAELAGQSASQIASLQALYAQRGSAQNSLGSQAAASYTDQINQLTRTNQQLTATLNKLEHAVERGARNGTQGHKRATATKHKARG